jgi:hypothetical protein
VNWQQNESFAQMAVMQAPPWLSSVQLAPSASPEVHALWSHEPASEETVLPASELPASTVVPASSPVDPPELDPPELDPLPLPLPEEPPLLLRLLPPKHEGGGAASGATAAGGLDVHVVVAPPGSGKVPLTAAVGDSTSNSVQVLFHW